MRILVINTIRYYKETFKQTYNIFILIIISSDPMHHTHSPKSQKLIQLHNKFSKLNSPTSDHTSHTKVNHHHTNHYPQQTYHNCYKHQLHLQKISKQHKVVQTDLNKILDQVQQNYTKYEQKTIQTCRHMIDMIANLQRIFCNKLAQRKNKQTRLIKNEIQNLMKYDKKIKILQNVEDTPTKKKQKGKILDQSKQISADIQAYDIKEIMQKVKQFHKQRKQQQKQIDQLVQLHGCVKDLYNKYHNNQIQTKFNLEKLQANIYSACYISSQEEHRGSIAAKIRPKNSQNTSVSKQSNLIQDDDQESGSKNIYGFDRKKQGFSQHLKFFRVDSDKEFEQEMTKKINKQQKLYESDQTRKQLDHFINNQKENKNKLDKKNQQKDKEKIQHKRYKNIALIQQQQIQPNKDYDKKTQKNSKAKKPKILPNNDVLGNKKHTQITLNNSQFQKNLNTFMYQLKKDQKRAQISQQISSKQASIDVYPFQKLNRIKSQQNIIYYRNNRQPSENLQNTSQLRKSNQFLTSKISANNSKAKLRQSLVVPTGRSGRFIETNGSRMGLTQSATSTSRKGNWAIILKQQQTRYNQMRKKIKN